MKHNFCFIFVLKLQLYVMKDKSRLTYCIRYIMHTICNIHCHNNNDYCDNAYCIIMQSMIIQRWYLQKKLSARDKTNYRHKSRRFYYIIPWNAIHLSYKNLGVSHSTNTIRYIIRHFEKQTSIRLSHLFLCLLSSRSG